MNSHGAGINAAAMNPRRLFPHPIPSLLYMGRPARGSTAPAMDRITALAARAEAA